MGIRRRRVHRISSKVERFQLIRRLINECMKRKRQEPDNKELGYRIAILIDIKEDLEKAINGVEVF